MSINLHMFKDLSNSDELNFVNIFQVRDNNHFYLSMIKSNYIHVISLQVNHTHDIQ
jgi:hypothetical protein